MMYKKIDSSGFLCGELHSANVNEFNRDSVVRIDVPRDVLKPFEKWRWVNNEWKAVKDFRGHTWYNPDNIDEVFESSEFDSFPPESWTYWEPGKNKAVKPSEVLRKRWKDIREERSKKLSASDWVVTKSMEKGEPIPEEWLSYRQALRDISLQEDPFLLVWPLAPDTDSESVFIVGAM